MAWCFCICVFGVRPRPRRGQPKDTASWGVGLGVLKTSSILCLVFSDSDILVVFCLLRIGSLAHQTGGSPEGGKGRKPPVTVRGGRAGVTAEPKHFAVVANAVPSSTRETQYMHVEIRHGRWQSCQ
jgi:hypothetical protein